MGYRLGRETLGVLIKGDRMKTNLCCLLTSVMDRSKGCGVMGRKFGTFEIMAEAKASSPLGEVEL